jgi:uncharacterized membrane protein YdbT with pleckstrin-like domain
MYELLKALVVRFLKVPPEPDDPLGAEGSLIVFRASPNYFKYRLITWGIGQVIGYVVTLVLIIVALTAGFGSGEGVGILLGLGVALILLLFKVVASIFSYVTLRMDYEFRWYKVTDRSLRIREGIWNVREMTMMFENIQNISRTQGPVQRWLTISDLKVQTAGGGSGMGQGQEQNQMGVLLNMHEGFFRGVDNAEEIQTIMNERLKQSRASGLGDLDDEKEAPVAQVTGPSASEGEILDAARGLLEEVRGLRQAAGRLEV